MNRCPESTMARAWMALAAGLLLLLSFAAQAQGIRREAPADVKLARMAVTLPPQITIDGKPDQLSPGSRIRDLNNMIVLSASLAGRDLPVVYRRDAAGLVHEVWLLSEAEYGKLKGATSGYGSGVQQFLDMLALVFGARP